MTVRELIDAASRNPALPLALGLVPPVLAFVFRLMHPTRGGGVAPWRYLYAVLVYLVCVPGVGAGVLTAYTLFFTGENLLDKNVLVYVLPIVSMVVTLVLIGKSASFDDIPGFDRLSGLITLVTVTFLLLLVVHKMFIGIFFGASILTLIAVGAFLFALLKWGTHALFRGADEPRVKPPSFPEI
jgi:hypothetical protein